MTGPAQHDSTSSFIAADGKWEHTNRQSGLNTYLHGCAEQYRASMAGEFPNTSSSASAIGTAVHAAIEHEIDGMLCDEDNPDESMLVGLKAYNNIASDAGFRDEHGARKAGDLIIAAHTNWRREVKPKLHPVSTERTFKQVLLHEDEKRRIYANGTWDYHDKHLGLVDWKTSSREKARWEEQRWNVQSTMYTWVAEILGDIPPAPIQTFRLCVMVHGKSAIQWVELLRLPHHRDWLLRQMIQLAEQTEAQVSQWPLNDGTWLCSPKWCGKWDTCKGSLLTNVLDPWG